MFVLASDVSSSPFARKQDNEKRLGSEDILQTNVLGVPVRESGNAVDAPSVEIRFGQEQFQSIVERDEEKRRLTKKDGVRRRSYYRCRGLPSRSPILFFPYSTTAGFNPSCGPD